MEIANFSPRFARAAGLTMLLAPIQALATLFVPAQSVLAHTRPILSPAMACRDPVRSCTTLKRTDVKPAQTNVADIPVQRLKIVRQFEPGANRSCAGRLVISGRMSDVCAELERMAG